MPLSPFGASTIPSLIVSALRPLLCCHLNESAWAKGWLGTIASHRKQSVYGFTLSC